MTPEEAKAKITDAFRSYIPADDDSALDIVPSSLTAGKLYEAFVLAIAAEELTRTEGFDLRLVNSNYLSLKSAPGPINRSFPRIEVLANGRVVADIWTDVEFLSLSYSMRSGPAQRGDYHELDILVVEPGLSGRPTHDKIWLGIECKNTGYSKGLLKEILGVRREMSLLQGSRNTRFNSWPRSRISANPPSCLLVYSTDSAVAKYAGPGEVFGIDFFHKPLEF